MLKYYSITTSIMLCLAMRLSAEYPLTSPFDKGHLQVSSIHEIYYEQYGNPEGLPVVVVHGGPGGGCPPRFSRFFDPEFYRIILFDQRGANRSNPFGEMKENETHILVDDMEVLREHLKIDKWLLFGGSWGSTLSLAYGETYPDRCTGFILRGIFLGRCEDTKHVVYGMQKDFPEAFEEFVNFIPENERSDLIQAYYRRLMDPNPDIHMAAARTFMRYDLTCAVAFPNPEKLEKYLKDDVMILGVARTFFHYAIHDFFFENDQQLLQDIDKIKHLPAVIIHGLHDTICRPEGALTLHKVWPNSELHLIDDGGHSSDEKLLTKALVSVMDLYKIEKKFNKKSFQTSNDSFF